MQTLLVEPVPYWKVAGTGFYEQFLDTREWPQFMRAGRETTLAALRKHALRKHVPRQHAHRKAGG